MKKRVIAAGMKYTISEFSELQEVRGNVVYKYTSCAPELRISRTEKNGLTKIVWKYESPDKRVSESFTLIAPLDAENPEPTQQGGVFKTGKYTISVLFTKEELVIEN